MTIHNRTRLSIMRVALGQRMSPWALGFTLIELMVTIAIAAILATLAVPALTRFIDDNAIRGACEELRNSLTLARAEAIRGSRLIHVAPSCSTPTWATGWAVFADTGSTANCFDASDTLILRANQPSRGVTITLVASPTTSTYMAYTGAGVTRMSDGSLLSGTFTCSISGSSAPNRTLVINTFGRVR
jgi:type IV fimbrial biogenesis protein FimT